MAWEHAHKIINRQGAGQATEEEIAQVVEALLDKASQGPAGSAKASKAARRVAGRTRATTSRPAKLPPPDPGPPEPAGTEELEHSDGTGSGTLAEVIPLGVFDAQEEAKHWW
jgi:putative transposase